MIGVLIATAVGNFRNGQTGSPEHLVAFLGAQRPQVPPDRGGFPGGPGGFGGPGGPGGRGGPSPEAESLVDKFDTDADGKLNDTERS